MTEFRPVTAATASGEPSYGTLAAPQPQTMASAQQKAELAVGLEPDEDVLSSLCPHNLSCAMLVCAPVCLPFGLRTVQPREQRAIVYWGEYKGSLKEPGLYLMNPCGLEMRKVSTKKQTMNFQDIKVLDAKGNPVVLSGVVTFYGTSAKKATIDVDRPWPSMSPYGKDSFLEMQAAAVLKRVASQFPYEAPPGAQSLQSEGAAIAEQLRSLLQEKVAVTGAFILSFELVDLSYAPEIAQVMLVRQQAEALVDARKCIVSAAVDMTTGALKKLRDSGEQLDQSTCQAVTTNLLTVICSQTSATPTVPMRS